MSSARKAPRIALPVVFIAVAMVCGGVWTAIRSTSGGDGEKRPGSATTSPPPPLERDRSATASGPDIVLTDGPSAYTVTYEVREPGRPPARETIEVARPYGSRRATSNDVTVTAFGRLSITPKKGARTIASPPPAAVDPRPSLVVPRALEEGFLTERERRVVAGLPCQVYRSLGPASSATISAALPGKHTDICINEDGLVLEEWQVDGDRAVRQRVAIGIERTASVPAIAEAPTISAAQGGGSVLAVETTSRPEGRFFELDAPPEGFALRGRYSVVPPQAGLTDETKRRSAVASTADVFERGSEVLIVDRGNTLNLERAFQPRPEGRPVADLGPAFGGAEGELLLSWTGPEVRWADEDGRFVRVYGTVAIDVILATVRALRVSEGGRGLVFTGAEL